LAFDLLLSVDDIRRRQPLIERWVLRKSRGGIQYVDHTKGDGAEMCEAVCKLGLEGIVSKTPDAPYRAGPSKVLDKSQKPEVVRDYSQH